MMHTKEDSLGSMPPVVILDAPLYERVEQVSQTLQISATQLVAQAVEEFLNRQQQFIEREWIATNGYKFEISSSEVEQERPLVEQINAELDAVGDDAELRQWRRKMRHYHNELLEREGTY